MKRDRLQALIGGAALGIAVLLPLLALVPFGWLWLWQNGYVLYWLGTALAISLVTFGVRTWALSRLRAALAASSDSDLAPGIVSQREAAARAEVVRLADIVDPARIVDRESLSQLGIETIEAVARKMHPELERPLWNFTVPEALTLIERVARRLRPEIVANVPLGDRLTIGQMMQLYQWRKVVDMASAAYDIWRIVRMVNPVSAVTQEIRERVSKSLYTGLREQLAKRLAARFVTEVGEAAIELYSGRLSLETAAAEAAPDANAAEDAALVPIRVLLAGRTSSGKSSLINALGNEIQAPHDVLPQTREFRSYMISRDGLPLVELVDSPGIETADQAARIAEEAGRSDLLIWVLPADRPDRALDRDVLDRLARTFAESPDRVSPPILAVMTHIDRLRPFGEWAPPYDVVTAGTAKARSIGEALAAVSVDLGIAVDRVVPVVAGGERAPYNIDVAWAKIADVLPAARSAQLLRRVAAMRGSIDWRRLLGQAVGAGRVAAGELFGQKR